jgi:hypothetical protein
MWVRFVLSGIYGCLAMASYLWDFTILLMLLAIPWSIPLMMLSYLIVHVTVEGEKVIAVGSLIGVIVNICLYVFIPLIRK